MGNWFSQESRGLIFGIWCTCQNMGNIGGNILANFMRDDLNMTWMTALRTIGICIGGLGVINFLLLIEHPHKVGIVVELTDEVRLLNIESICEDIQKRKSYVNKTHHDHHDEQKIQNEERNINLHSIQHKEDHTEEEKEVHDN